MPLQVAKDKESVFCLDFTREKEVPFSPYEITIPELVYRKCASDRIAFDFDAEKVTLNFGQVKAEMEAFAAGLLSTGLKANDRVLICAYNVSALVPVTLGVARAGLVFALANPNFGTPEQLRHLLAVGDFRAVILFAAPGTDVDRPHNLMLSICPELREAVRGKLEAQELPTLTHVILADEDHKHAGTYTLSDIFGRSNKHRIEKLPDYSQWNAHKLAAVAFSMGSTGPPKAVGLTHYQLVNGCRVAAAAIGIQSDTVLTCALPLFRLPVFALVVLTPFLTESRSVFAEPSPVPRNLFSSIKKFQCTTVLSNAAALRLGLRMFYTHKVTLPSVATLILLGERVSTELLQAVDRVMSNATRIAVGMLSAEAGAVPLLSDNTTNLIKAVGKPLEGFDIEIAALGSLSTPKRVVGEMRIRPIAGTKFIGYGPHFNAITDYIETGDIVAQTLDGNIEIVAHKSDVIYDRNDQLVEHWKMERLMASYENIKGVQVVQVCPGAPVTAIVIPRTVDCEFIKADLSALCRSHKVPVPDYFAIIDDFPRVNTKIQKYKLRNFLRANLLQLY